MADRELSRAPSMAPMFARAALATIPGAARLPFVGARGTGHDAVPETTLTLSDVAVDRTRLAAYDRVCGFDVADTLPPTYPHMLAFPLQLALITDPDFPIPSIGLVHIANRIVVRRRLEAAQPLSLRVWATAIEPHPRGRRFTIRTEAHERQELVWEEWSTMLHRGPGEESTKPPLEAPSSEALPVTATWRLRGDLGRRYGGVSGDLNPIHVHALTARLFGFDRAIAHGMWTKARCLAALASELPERFAVDVAFKRPIALPAVVSFAEGRSDAGIGFGVRSADGTPHLDGLVSH